MAYAPHTNADTRLPRILGCFRHRETEPYFEYALRRLDTDTRGGWLAEDFPHLVYTADGDRIAKVLKTVAHVVVNEDADGNGVVEIWPLRQHREYPL